MYPERIRHFINSNPPAGDDLAVANGSLIAVNVAEQTLSLFKRFDHRNTYRISTSKFGCGNQENSFKTPTGLHAIAEKIGEGAAEGEIFIARKSQGRCFNQDDLADGKDIISTRIMWLNGLEPGVNRGGACDSFNRYIYIHGTADEAHLGKPASIGCIRMSNTDVIDLFNQVEVNDRVLIG